MSDPAECEASGAQRAPGPKMRVLVAGFGNLLREDDGFGVRLLRLLRDGGEAPGHVQFLDVGIGGISLVQDLLSGFDVLVVLDAIEGSPPGKVSILHAEVPDFTSMPEDKQRDFFADIHYAEPNRALVLAKAVGALPSKVYIIGCTIGPQEMGEVLSPAVESALAGAATQALALLRNVSGASEEVRPCVAHPEPHAARRRIHVRGIVQGVGFRPFVYQRARELGLRGSVRNGPDGVRIDVEGDPHAIETLIEHVWRGPNAMARTDAVEVERDEPIGAVDFVIAESASAGARGAWPPADVAPCDDCRRELADPTDRRHRYPFINCTACGPRFTIVRGIPYDRAKTTMASFALCEACRAEYEDPGSRRFHAEPNACPRCGPSLTWLVTPPGGGSPVGRAARTGEAAFEACIESLRSGKIVAIRGVGGFHLACDATSNQAVATLRRRKERDAKPFAMMAKDVAAIRELAEVSLAARDVLASPERPIVLLARRATGNGPPLADGIAPGLAHLGFMLPPSALHQLLADVFGGPLVMTSGNVSDEPIAIDNDDALARLAPIADAFLLHDRDIHTQVDDSVVRVEMPREITRILRRARGYVPDRVALETTRPVLATGGDLKNTFCLAALGSAFVSQHIGDLHDPSTQLAWRKALERFTDWLAIVPEVIACDLHPDYASTRIAESFGLPLIRVQHHHAHVAACLAEHGITECVVGVVYDGAGFGDDGEQWGGEILVADRATSVRAAHVRQVRLPGGDAAAREPWRMALAYLDDAGEPLEGCHAPPSVDAPSLDVLARAARRGLASPWTSSVGRLFDAVAATCGIRSVGRFEGQAAMELEAAAMGASGDAEAYPYDVDRTGAIPRIDFRAMTRAIASDLRVGASAGIVSARFHETLATATAAVATVVAAAHGLGTVVLSGGCFQNERLARACETKLLASGLRVLRPARFPANDGGLSLGQAAVAAARMV